MKRVLTYIFAILLCVLSIFGLFGCSLRDVPNAISSVRARADKLRHEMSETMITAFKTKDVTAVKDLFCPKSQQLDGIDSQIEATFDFMEGDISSYKISSSIGYEGCSTDYGKVTEYEFNSDTFITTDLGRQYKLSIDVIYIGEDSSIEGLTSYYIREFDRGDDDYKICRAGYGWTSPYDAECGVLSAQLITAIASKDANELKSLFCAKALESETMDAEIQSVFDMFEGEPIFNERADGLYNYTDAEDDFSCRVLGYDITKDKSGTPIAVWVHVLTRPVCTDAGEKYRLDFVAYLCSDKKPEIEGVSYLSLEDLDNDDNKVDVGEWIHEE